jgi:hypothetical protein
MILLSRRHAGKPRSHYAVSWLRNSLSAVTSLLERAQTDGILTLPASVEALFYDYADSEDGGGFRWLVYVKAPEARNGMGSLRLASVYHEARGYGHRESRGADAALDVLRQAVRDANGVLDDLAAYVQRT